MSYSFWGMAVRADQTAVFEALRGWPNEREARLEPIAGSVSADAGWIDFVTAPHEGWTVFHFSVPLIPALAIHLSRALDTRVISIDENEVVGYEHFSVLDAGTVSRLFTRQMVVEERVGIDLSDFFQKALESPKYRFPLGPLRGAIEYAPHDEGVETEMESEVFRIFNIVVSDINVEDIAVHLEGPSFRIWVGAHDSELWPPM